MTGLSAPRKKRMRRRTACSAPVERYLVESPLSLRESKKFVRDEGNKDWVVGTTILSSCSDCASKVR
jgi:hypothetical protein